MFDLLGPLKTKDLTCRSFRQAGMDSSLGQDVDGSAQLNVQSFEAVLSEAQSRSGHGSSKILRVQSKRESKRGSL